MWLLPSPWVEIARYFGSAENSDLIGEKLSEMLKYPARESYHFTLIVFALTEQYLLFSNSGRFSWYESVYFVRLTTST